ncbi:MAG TPA: argininosuccinate lyase [Candidatus Acidoferrales bacterium]|nr:argininosuccinate lyase [Candidatus Acidoferrales bacterium]
MAKLWGGRFKKSASKLMEEFNDSLPFDKRLWKEEIEASRAYSTALTKAGIFSKPESAKIRKAFGELEKEFISQKFKFNPGDEDIHTAIERRLVEKVGEIGKKIHTGRSRNEQVVTDERLYLRKAVGEIKGAIRDLQASLLVLSRNNAAEIVPSYTHLQQAQLISLGHYFMSLFFMLENDLCRFTDAEKRICVLPLGSGAVAGSTVKLDREVLKQELGFDYLSPNSIAAVSDRDSMAEFLFGISQTLVHLSRFAEDLIVWSSIEFGFIELDDLYSTGSSMMPQKKNPDSLELIRGKASRVISNLNSILMMQKGLPLTYSKDLQEDKEPLFDSTDTIISSLKIFTGVISTLKVRAENLLRKVDDSIYATDIADYLVERGVPFRDAHRVVGRLVLSGIDKNKSLRDFSLKELKEISPLFDKKYFEVFDPVRSVNRRDVYGGTNLKRVKEQIELAEKILAAEKSS